MKRNSALALAALNEQPVSAPHPSPDTLVAATSQIVSAYIVNRPAEAMNLSALTAEVFATLRQLAAEEVAQLAQPTGATSNHARKPVVAVEESIKGDYLVCLEDGKRVKMLKRHLKTSYNMTPEEYRARWSLPTNYPMVAPNYAQVRSKLAKEIGLGRRGMPSVAKRMVAAATTL